MSIRATMLVDTGAWYALADVADRHHEEAREFHLAHGAKAQFATTDLIAAETFALLTAHLSRNAATAFWERIRITRTPVLPIDETDFEAAWHIAQTFTDQDFSLVDCTTFALMERLGIDEAFAFDSHFLVYRFGPARQRAFKRFPR